MKSSEFITEGDDKNIADVQANHPSIYQFLVSLIGRPALEQQTQIEATTGHDGTHTVRIVIQPSPGLGNTKMGLEAEGVAYKETKGISDPKNLYGTLDDGTKWNVMMQGQTGNLAQYWLFSTLVAESQMEDGVANQNWFDTLAAALEAEGLSDTWDGITMGGIGYGETRRYTYDDGTRQGHFVSIYRDDSGRYERPVHYARGNAIRK